VLGGKYSKCIVILQEFDLEFEKSKSKKSLVFYELICDLPSTETKSVSKDLLPNEHLFLINSADLWYGYIIIYLQVVICLGMPLPKKFFERGIFGRHYLRISSLLIQKCHACQIYNHKLGVPPAPLHPVVSSGPFAKWGIDFMTCNPHSVRGHGYIIVIVDYFTKWAKAMPTFNKTRKIATLIQIIFGTK
jgi:hypothetical protein